MARRSGQSARGRQNGADLRRCRYTKIVYDTEWRASVPAALATLKYTRRPGEFEPEHPQPGGCPRRWRGRRLTPINLPATVPFQDPHGIVTGVIVVPTPTARR
jgi:hypothetical protein